MRRTGLVRRIGAVYLSGPARHDTDMNSRRPSAREPFRALLAVLLTALVAAVLAPLLAPPPASARAPPAAAPAASSAGSSTDGDALHFGDDAVRPRTAAGSRASYAWRGSRLYVRETLPSRCD